MIEFRLATKEDNAQLIELTAAVGMDGEISLRIDRNPDFFKLLELRGESMVAVAEDNGKIIGVACASLQNCYLDGKLCPVQYVGDFKVLKAYRKKGVGLSLLNLLVQKANQVGSDLVFLNISKGNEKPMFHFKNQSTYPDFVNIGLFSIYQFIGKKRKSQKEKYPITSETSSVELLNFLDENYQKYELGSQVTKEQLEKTSIYTIRDGGLILGAVCLVDTMKIKQNVVTKVSWRLNLLLKLLNLVSPITGLSKMPVLNEPVKMMYIKFLAIRDNDKHILKRLIDHSRSIAYNKSYSFVSIGCHERDPLQQQFSGMNKLTFESIGMMTSLKNNTEYIDKVKAGIPFEDFSLV